MLKISIEAARVNAKLTQEQAAKLIGVSSCTIKNWENGYRPVSTKYFKSIENAYKIPLENLSLY